MFFENERRLIMIHGQYSFPLCLLQPLGLMKGITSPLYGLAAINAIVFGVQGNVQRYLQSDSLRTHFIAGAVAGSVLFSC